MFISVVMLKRRAGLSVQDFRDYYERHHARIGEKYLKGHVRRYVRRYLTAIDGREPEYDVLTEVWTDDAASYARLREILAHPDARTEIEADERRLFDTTAKHYYSISEVESLSVE